MPQKDHLVADLWQRDSLRACRVTEGSGFVSHVTGGVYSFNRMTAPARGYFTRTSFFAATTSSTFSLQMYTPAASPLPSNVAT